VFGCGVTPARECFGLDLIKPPVVIKHSDRGAATIPALDADGAAIDKGMSRSMLK
jgi:hypothetical protein